MLRPAAVLVERRVAPPAEEAARAAPPHPGPGLTSALQGGVWADEVMEAHSHQHLPVGHGLPRGAKVDLQVRACGWKQQTWAVGCFTTQYLSLGSDQGPAAVHVVRATSAHPAAGPSSPTRAAAQLQAAVAVAHASGGAATHTTCFWAQTAPSQLRHAARRGANRNAEGTATRRQRAHPAGPATPPSQRTWSGMRQKVGDTW